MDAEIRVKGSLKMEYFSNFFGLLSVLCINKRPRALTGVSTAY